MSVTAHATEADARIGALRRARPRNGFLRFTVAFFLLLLGSSWFLGSFDVSDTFSTRRAENLDRFVQEVRPWPLREETDDGMRPLPWDWDVFADWAGERMEKGVSGRDTMSGWEALEGTLAISVLAIVLASLASLGACWFAARNIATPRPFATHAPDDVDPVVRWAWRGVVLVTRTGLILLRALPEYILAYLILGLFGSTAWPAVLALAIHNTGILGRLNAETVENTDERAPRALRALGAGRARIAAVAIWPAMLPRFLLYFFYRWETCVREATVLGILHLASLGWLIDEAKVAGFRYDEMVFFIALGALLVLGGDLVSALARRLVRRAS